MRDIAVARGDSSETAGELIDLDNRLNELWGPVDFILYTMETGVPGAHILGGDATEEQAALAVGDELTV